MDSEIRPITNSESDNIQIGDFDITSTITETVENEHIVAPTISQLFSVSPLESDDETCSSSFEYVDALLTDDIATIAISKQLEVCLPFSRQQDDENIKSTVDCVVDNVIQVQCETLCTANINESASQSTSERTLTDWKINPQLLNNEAIILGSSGSIAEQEQVDTTVSSDQQNNIQAAQIIEDGREMIVDIINSHHEDNGQLLLLVSESLTEQQDDRGQPSECGEPQIIRQLPLTVTNNETEDEESISNDEIFYAESEEPAVSHAMPKELTVSQKRKSPRKTYVNNREPYFLRKVCRFHQEHSSIENNNCILDGYFAEFWPDITHHYNLDFGISSGEHSE